jgi:hypothetical protein
MNREYFDRTGIGCPTRLRKRPFLRPTLFGPNKESSGDESANRLQQEDWRRRL